MSNPLVSVIMNCYNHQDYVAQSITSVLEQTYSPIQLLVIDDFSSDNSRTVIRDMAERHGFQYIFNDVNSGVNYSLLKALAYCEGEYIALIASDDWFTPNKVREQMAYLLRTGDDGVYANGYSWENGREKPIALNKVFQAYRQDKALHYIYQYDWGAPLLQSALFKRQLLTDLIQIRKEFKSDDWAFTIKAFEQYKIGFIETPVFYYRLHPTNTHKKYWFTFPMRIDIGSRLVPDGYRLKTTANILLSQAQYLFLDRRYARAVKFFLASLALNFSFRNIGLMLRAIGGSIKTQLRNQR